jgi:hypothetical protein
MPVRRVSVVAEAPGVPGACVFPSHSVTDSVTSDWQSISYDTLVKAASSTSAADRCMSGVTCLERLRVMLMSAYPGRACTIVGCLGFNE